MLLSLIRFSIKWREDAWTQNKESKSLIIIYLQFIFDRKCRCNHTSPFLPKYADSFFTTPKRYSRLFIYFVRFFSFDYSSMLPQADCCWFKLILWFLFFLTISIHCSYPRWFNRFTECCCYCSCHSRKKIQIYIQALLSRAQNTITCISMYVCAYDIVMYMLHVIYILYRIVFCVVNMSETKTTIKIKRTLCPCVKC